MLGRFFFLLIIFCFFGPSCTSNHHQDPNTIVIGVETFAKTLDPRYGTDAISSKICRLLYNGLFTLNNQLEIVPDLAQDYEYESDTVLKINLKTNVVFHDGHSLKAQDVLATYQSVQDPKTQSPYRGSFSKIEKIELLNDYQLKIILKEPYAPLLTSLTMGILPSEEIKKYSSGNHHFTPIGTGPYQFESLKEGQKVILKQNELFFGELPKNKRVIFKTIPDNTVRTYEILQGSVDLVQNAIPYVLLPSFKNKKDLVLEKVPGINMSYMGFNLKDPILKNKKVRQAIALAINRDHLIQYKFKNMATKAHSILSPTHWAYHSQLSGFEYNPQKARELLDEAGYKNPPGSQSRFHLEYKTSTNKDRVAIALLIAEQLKEVGIDVEVKPYEWGTFFKDVTTGNFQIYTLSWVGVTDPDIYYDAFHSTQIPPHGRNRGYYQNAQIDSLVEEGRKILDQNKRKLIYHQVQAILLRDLPYIPLWYEDNYVIRKKELQGFKLRPDAGFGGVVEASKNNPHIK